MTLKPLLHLLRVVRSLFAGVCGVLEGGRRLLVDGVFARVPLGHHALLLEARELAAVVDGGDHLPQHQQRQPHQHDGRDHAQHDAQDEYLLGALPFLLRPDVQVLFLVVRVHEHVQAVVFFVLEAAQVLISGLVRFQFPLLGDGRDAVGVLAGLEAHLLVAPLRAAVVHLAQHALLELLAAPGACWAFIAVSA